MDVRLVQLLASFIRVSAQYALARLEYAVAHADQPAPVALARLPDASEATLLLHWPTVESDLERALAYAKQIPLAQSRDSREDHSTQWLRRTLQELDQYARAIRWVMTVTQR